MTVYIIRRFLYSIPIVIGVIFIAYLLFFGFTTPENLARNYLGKNPTKIQVKNWIKNNHLQGNRLDILLRQYKKLLSFNFGTSYKDHESISDKILRGMGPSLALAIPSFILSLILTISISLLVSYYRGSYLDKSIFYLSVILMSLSTISYIIVIQKIMGQFLMLCPVYGYARGLESIKFLILPVSVSIIASLGGTVRFYRIVFLDQTNKDYIRTAKAKGLKESVILFKHILKNAMIPILTTVVMQIPFLFTGSLILESYFGIPGLGRMTLTAVMNGDFPVIIAMVYIGSLLFIFGTILTDISYTLVDPRVTFESDENIWTIYIFSLMVPFIFLLLLYGYDHVAGSKLIKGIPECDFLKPVFIENAICLLIGIAAYFLIRYLLRSLYWQEKWKIFKKNKISILALLVIIIFFGIAFLDSIVVPIKTESGIVKDNSVIDILFNSNSNEKSYSVPAASYLFDTRNPEKLKSFHLLGTDILGRDVLLRLLKGTRTAVLIGGLTGIIVIPLAIIFGMTAGYYGGKIDDIIQYIYTTVASVPTILLLIAMMTVFGRGILQLSIALGLCGWVGLARLIRAETMKHKKLDYIKSAKALGLSDSKIMYVHILPNISHLIIIRFVLLFGGLVLSEVILSYLGLGVKPGQGSWGDMISGAENEIMRNPSIWWIFTFSSMILFIFVLSLNILGDKLRDALDPKLINKK